MPAEQHADAQLAAGSSPAPSELTTPELIERRRVAMARYAEAFEGVDDLDPKGSAGHAYGVRKSAWLTQDYRRIHRRQAMNIGPQEVIEVLVAAGVKNWVLMGLHGYVGYLAMPRATQDVDVMVPYSERKRAVRAIRNAWPDLILREYLRRRRCGHRAVPESRAGRPTVSDLTGERRGHTSFVRSTLAPR